MELLDSFKFPAREQLVSVPLEKQSWRSVISIWLENVFSLFPPLPLSPLPASSFPLCASPPSPLACRLTFKDFTPLWSLAIEN